MAFSGCKLALALLLCGSLAACYDDDAGDARPSQSPSALAAAATTLFPAGILLTPAARSSISGVYPVASAEAPSCCWLGQEARFRVAAASGAKTLEVTVYEPAMGDLATAQEIALLDTAGKTFSSHRVTAGLQTFSLAIPRDASTDGTVSVTLRMSRVIVPKTLGINTDPRQLSVVLRRVSAR